MSLFDYQVSQRLAVFGALMKEDCYFEPSFYSLIMAAMRRADPTNLMLLRQAFPDTWRELNARYNAPGGKLPGEP